MNSTRDILNAIALPLFALAAVVVFYAFWVAFDLPPQDEVIASATTYFEQYGLMVVFVCAILEALLFAGWYFPGSLVITLAVVIAGKNISQVTAVLIVTTIAFVIAHSFNYFLGKYGWYHLFAALGFKEPIENAKQQLLKYGPRAVLLTYFHPNLGALTATAAGILDMPFARFTAFSILAATLWDIFWTVIAYFIGQAAITITGPKFVIPFIFAWIVATLVYKFYVSRVRSVQAMQPPQA